MRGPQAYLESHMQERPARRVPRPFAVHWGKGQIVEEASYDGEHHRPCIQLLEFEDGSFSIRLCYYNHEGRFQRSPLMVGEDGFAGLREALTETPRLTSLLRDIVAQPGSEK